MESMGQKGAEVANRPPNFVPVFRSFLLLGKRERYAKDMWNDVRSILQHVTRSPAGAMCLLNASRGKAVLPRHLPSILCVSAICVRPKKPMPNTTYCLDLDGKVPSSSSSETCQDSISSCRCDRGKEWVTTDEANLGTPDTDETADTTTQLLTWP